MFGDLGKQAFNALRHNRRRSILTMLGMAWGIATVVLLLAYGAGFENALMIAFRTFGGNLVAIFPGHTSVQAGGTKAGVQIRLTRDDLDYLRAEVSACSRVFPLKWISKVSWLLAHAAQPTAYTESIPATRQCARSMFGEGIILRRGARISRIPASR